MLFYLTYFHKQLDFFLSLTYVSPYHWLTKKANAGKQIF